MSPESNDDSAQVRTEDAVLSSTGPQVGNSRFTVTHFGMQLRSLTGAARFLKSHHDRDLDYGIDSEIVPFFQRKSDMERVVPAKMSWPNSILAARRRFRKTPTRRPVSMAVYHDLWESSFWRISIRPNGESESFIRIFQRARRLSAM